VTRVLLLSAFEPSPRLDTDLGGVVAELRSALECEHVEIRSLGEAERAVRRYRPDVVFNACETLGGRSEDEPLVPLLLERMGVAFTGSTARTLRRCLRKSVATEALRAAGVLVPATFTRADAVVASAYPLIVKPDCEDGSIGIDDRSVVADEAALRRAFAAHESEGRPAIAQTYVDGREIAVAFLGAFLGGEPRVLPPGEILYDATAFAGRAQILTYASKWEEGSRDYAATTSVGAELGSDLRGRVAAATRRAVRALGMRDYGRVDFRLDARGRPFVIDANPNCDLSEDGGFMRAAARAGLSLADAVHAIVASALERAARGRTEVAGARRAAG
jgi:D-alanine-D-alanine ligase